MKQKGQPRKITPTRRPLPIILTLLFLALVSIIIAKLIVNSSTSPDSEATNLTSPSSSNVSAPTSATNTSEPSVEKDPISKEPIKYDGENPNDNDSLSGSITTARISGDKFIIRVNIDQYLSSGSCTLALTGDGPTYEDATSIIPAASTSTCQGFDVPRDSLDSGTYTIEITLNSNDKSGKITGEVNL